MIKLLKRLFFPASYYRKRLEDLHNRFLAETEKDKLLASFAKWLLPYCQYFQENCIEDNTMWVIVDKYQFSEVYKMGVIYWMGIKILWQ